MHVGRRYFIFLVLMEKFDGRLAAGSVIPKNISAGAMMAAGGLEAHSAVNFLMSSMFHLTIL